MIRMLLTLGAGIVVGASGMFAAHDHVDGEKVKVLSAIDIKEKLDGKEATATAVEVTIEPGQAGVPHRHPGSAIGYVVEGEYELGIDDQPTRVLRAGETFYEPAGCLHRVSKNPGKARARVLAWVIHPRDARDLVLPADKK